LALAIDMMEADKEAVTGTSTQTGHSRVPFTASLRLALFVALILAGIALVRFTPLGDVLSEDYIRSLIHELRGLWWAPLVLIGLYMTLGILGLPPGPLMLGGAAFGAFYGTIYNTLGLFSGAALGFMVAKLLGRDFILHVAGKKLQRFEDLSERRGFWPLVQTRFLPIPFMVVNFGAALAGVRPTRFLTASALGLLPSTLIHTYFIAKLLETQGTERLITLVLYGSAFVVFNLLITALWVRKPSR